MNFWESELGTITGNEQDSFIKSFKQIPDGTMALAKITHFANGKHKDGAGNEHNCLVIDWLIIDGDFKGQKVNQKIKCFDANPNTRHKALNMLKLLYDMFSLKPQGNEAPTDQALSSFNGKMAGLCIRETEPMGREGKQFNWVSEVHRSNGFVCVTGIKLEVVRMPNNMATNAALPDFPISDDVPF